MHPMHPILERLSSFPRSVTLSLTIALNVVPVAQALAVPGDQRQDYAHAIPVSVSGKHAVVQLPVPRAVYLAARQPGLADLRLFDAAGRPMPFALIDQVQQAQEQRSSTPVAVFPVRGPAGSTRLPPGLEIRTGENGALISVTAPGNRGADDALASLVLDLQAGATASNPVAALALSLPPGQGSYSAQVALDISDDLQEWEELAVASLSWLVNRQGASVRKDRIAFPPRAFRFARIRWIDGTPVEFSAVAAERLATERVPERWESVVLQPGPATGTDLLYEAPIAVPVESIGLALQHQNVVMPVLVGHYQKQPDRRTGSTLQLPLRPVANATFYRLTQDGQPRVSGDIAVPLTHASQWVVRPQGSAPERPGLRLRWKPAVLVFVAGGAQPYTLAFGRDAVRSGAVPLSQVAPGFSMRELAVLEQAQAGTPVRLQAEADIARGAYEERQASRTRVTWLWALLLAGVAVLAGMVWKLSRQMKGASEGTPPA
ncbi:DUF3999 domain-containing protein [Massilia oculi]|uniref:DUF3999 domain-containing protein n=1 Tax=Massilia hydrophila TaxID=3044279 RepID=A0ABS7YG27_9BURK|nr:DUF3999 family protein [Massilia oculi]MCA1857901.1 DUF3999 domain-containing protein [Massilia oculi]